VSDGLLAALEEGNLALAFIIVHVLHDVPAKLLAAAGLREKEGHLVLIQLHFKLCLGDLTHTEDLEGVPVEGLDPQNQLKGVQDL
jgi:hypothetical protein